MILFGAFVWNVVLSGVAIKNQPIEHNNIPKVEEDKTTRNTRTLLFFKEKYSNVVTLFHHKNLIVLLVMEIVGYYMFTSWALFLFSLGSSSGLSANDAALLSTCGGLGGCAGRGLTFVVLSFKKVNAITSAIIPFLVTGVSLLAFSLAHDFVTMAALAFVSGVTQAFNSSAIFGVIATAVCTDHYETVVVLELALDGFAMQFAGLISGKFCIDTPYSLMLQCKRQAKKTHI